jgi:hypothetical protein
VAAWSGGREGRRLSSRVVITDSSGTGPVADAEEAMEHLRECFTTADENRSTLQVIVHFSAVEGCFKLGESLVFH